MNNIHLLDNLKIINNDLLTIKEKENKLLLSIQAIHNDIINNLRKAGKKEGMYANGYVAIKMLHENNKIKERLIIQHF